MGTAAWVARTESSSIDVGLDREEAYALASDLVARLRQGELNSPDIKLDADVLDVLHAVVECVAREGVVGAVSALEDMSRIHDLISATEPSETTRLDRADLLRRCSLWAWRLARRAGRFDTAEAWALHQAVSDSESTEALHDLEVGSLKLLDDVETLVALREHLRRNVATDPRRNRDNAELLHRHLERLRKPIGLADEHRYFLGEFALVAGTACRFLSLRREANEWFGRAEAAFAGSANAEADLARVSYQRLAVQVEERAFADVLARLPELESRFSRLGMAEDALKCRFIEWLARLELGQLSEAAAAFEELRQQALSIGSEPLLADALTNLVHVYGLLGDVEKALNCSKQVLPLLVRLGKRVNVGKVHWGIGSLLRAKGQCEASIEAYRVACDEFAALGLAADVVATRLMIADLSLEIADDSAAMREIVLATAIIEEYKLVSEGVAALALLRESIQQKRVSQEALRELYQFFRGSVS